MLLAHTVTIGIERPARDVYRFLTSVQALVEWLQLGAFTVQEGGDPRLLEFETDRGTVKIDMTADNQDVLDYGHWQDGQPLRKGAVRVLQHGEGCVLVHTGLQQPGVSAEAFVSEQTWIETDLQVLKSLLEQ